MLLLDCGKRTPALDGFGQQFGVQIRLAIREHEGAGIVQQAGDEQAFRRPEASFLANRPGDDGAIHAASPVVTDVQRRRLDLRQRTHGGAGQREIVHLVQAENLHRTIDGFHFRRERHVRAVRDAQDAARQRGVVHDHFRDVIE